MATHASFSLSRLHRVAKQDNAKQNQLEANQSARNVTLYAPNNIDLVQIECMMKTATKPYAFYALTAKSQYPTSKPVPLIQANGTTSSLADKDPFTRALRSAITLPAGLAEPRRQRHLSWVHLLRGLHRHPVAVPRCTPTCCGLQGANRVGVKPEGFRPGRGAQKREDEQATAGRWEEVTTVAERRVVWSHGPIGVYPFTIC